MTTTVSTRSPGKLNPTRQQLDELDALLQRMLELPVNTLDDEEQTEDEEAVEEPSAPSFAPATPVIAHDNLMRPASPHVSYTVVETASPRPLPPASGFEPRPSLLTPRLVPVTTPPEVVDEESEPFAPPPRSMPMPAPMPLRFAEPEAVPTPTPTEGEMWVPLRSTWQPSAQTWQPLAESWHLANGGTTPPVAVAPPFSEPHFEPMPQGEILFPKPTLPTLLTPSEPLVEEEVISIAPPASKEETVPVETENAVVAEPPLRLSVEDAPVAVPRVLLPLLWFNQGFDACLTPLGAPGRWLCEPRGRQTLGLTGLTCLATAVALAVSAGMGWSW